MSTPAASVTVDLFEWTADQEAPRAEFSFVIHAAPKELGLEAVAALFELVGEACLRQAETQRSYLHGTEE